MTENSFILAVETSSRVGSVGIAVGPQLIAEKVFSGPMKHSEELFPAIQTLLGRFGRRPGDIEHVYISGGPGSFTGLRIAVSLAKSLHLADSVKVVSVDTLDVIAANVTNLDSPSDERRATSHDIVVPILDAKRGQFYVAVYKSESDNSKTKTVDKWEKIISDSIMTHDEILEILSNEPKPVWLLGDGLVYHKERFKAEGVCFIEEDLWRPRASKVHELGWQLALENKFIDPLLLTPNYLMRPDITIKRR